MPNDNDDNDSSESNSTDSDGTNQRSVRDQIQRMADEYGTDVENLLIQSKRRDPMWKGTAGDHAKARWFAELWREAVAGREQDEIHVRGVHYYITMNDLDVEPPTDTSWPVYRNTEKCYNYLESAAVLARILGYIPLDGIVDERAEERTITKYGQHRKAPDSDAVKATSGVETPRVPPPDAWASLAFEPDPEAAAEYEASTIAEQAADLIDFDRPSQSPFHVELWSEKTLPAYITGSENTRGVAEEAGANVVVEGKGDLSLTVANDLAQRIERAGKPAVILYLSDYDPKGTEMATNMAGKLAWLEARGDLEQRVMIERLAVTKEQIERLDLPRKPIAESEHTGTGGKSYNTKITEWEQRHGAGATELNALEQRPEAFRRIVRDAIESYTDESLPQKNADAVDEWQKTVEARLREAFHEADLDEDIEELEAWIEEFNERFGALADALRELQDLKNEGPYDEWQDRVEAIVTGTDFPAATVPEGEAPFPEDPLYDSAREYVQNVVRIDRYREGEGEGQDQG